MAPPKPSGGGRFVVDLVSDDDEPPAPSRSRTNTRGTVKAPMIDLSTPSPPPSRPRTVAFNSARRNRQPSVADLSTAPPRSHPTDTTSRASQPSTPAVKYSPPSAPPHAHSPTPPPNPRSTSTPRASGRNFAGTPIKKSPIAPSKDLAPSKPTSPALSVRLGSSPPRPTSPVFNHIASSSTNEPSEASSKSRSRTPEPVSQQNQPEVGNLPPRNDFDRYDEDEDSDASNGEAGGNDEGKGGENDADKGDEMDEDGSDEIEDLQISRSAATLFGSPSRESNIDTQSSQNIISSIGSTSPLITRLRQQKKQKQTAPTKALPKRQSQFPMEFVEHQGRYAAKSVTQAASNLEERLKGFLLSMQDDHALYTRYLLADAREAALEMNNLGVDKISPFASMKTVVLEPGDRLSPGKSKDIMYHYPVQRNGKLGKSNSQLIAKRVFGDTPRVPKYSSHTNIRRNILKADDEKLKFIPFLGDSRGEANYKRLVKELEEVYSPRSSETSREAEENARIRQYLPMWLEELHLGFDLDTIKHHLLLQDEETQASGELGIQPRNRRLLLESFGDPLDYETRQAAQCFCEAFDEVFGIASQDVILPSGLLKEMIGAARNEAAKKKRSPPTNRIGTYADLTCLICASIDCPTHGDFTHERVDSSDIEDEESDGHHEMKYEPKPLNLSYEDTLRRFQNRIKEEIEPLPRGTTKSCSEECYMAIDYSELDYEFDEEHLAILPQMIATYRNPNYRSCFIAFALDIPCWTVYAEIQHHESKYHENEQENIPTGRDKKPDWYDNKKKTITVDLNAVTSAHLHQQRGQAVACGHVGPCIVRFGDRGDSCPCASSNILCESFCGCSDDCPRRFTGCNCSGYGLSCTSDICICINMNRECGPECGTCGAVARINPVNKYDDELFKTGCQNVYLQRGVAKATVMGESQLAGFGLYVAEAVKKGDFLDEYTGENISSEEAERRGVVYDRKLLSFLFDLNQDRVIDAARLGNKTRFINHCGTAADGLNCEAKIVLVNGEHRIKFTALRDIDVGEELLFNYGKKFAEKQGLNKTLPKASAGSKRGVLVGEEALDALDGMDERKKGTREKINAIRGGGKAGDKKRGTKMRKTAAPPGPVVGDEDLDVSQKERDASTEENSDRRPRRRKVNRPARYTR